MTTGTLAPAALASSPPEALLLDPGMVLALTDLKMYFPVHQGVLHRQVGAVKALDGVTMMVREGETLGVVGESGCGKSTMGKCIIRLLDPTDGAIWYRTRSGRVVDLAGLTRHQLRPLRSEIQMIFQDPFSSLNPRMTVGEIIEEPLTIHEPGLNHAGRMARVHDLLQKVGLSREQSYRYPHEFSGGQRQRIGIARALATRPRLIIADEPVSALDVSIQAQVINLMQDLQEEFHLTYIFIAHDLAVVQHISDRILVMYLGNVAEYATADALYENPCHPYTRALLSAIPVADPRYRKPERVLLEGDVPSPLRKPSGCGFRTRCPIAQRDCGDHPPPMVEVAAGHGAACPYHPLWDELVKRPGAAPPGGAGELA